MTDPQNELELPHSVSAEQSVLGALMIKPESLPLVADWLSERAFFVDAHRVLYRAITELADRGDACDPVTIGDWLDSHGLADLVGGPGYVLRIANETPSAANIVAYAEIVAQRAQLREIMDIGGKLVAGAGERGADAAMVAGAAAAKLAELQAARLRGGLMPARAGVKAWFNDLFEKYEAGARVTGTPTPWDGINAATHGLQDGELVVLAGRPNMGKSILGDDIGVTVGTLCAAAGRGQVAVFALETTREKFVRRAISRTASVPHDWLVAPSKGTDDEAWWPRITSATQIISEARLLIDDTPALTVQQIIARARRAHLQEPVRLVIVDHLHIVRIAGRNVVQEIGDVSRGLKSLAKELGCPVVALAQLNRAVTGRTDRRPTMADLRSSGDIEQDADVVLLLHREDYYDADTHLRGVVEVELAKGRDVKTGARIYLRNEYDFMRAVDWEGPLPEPPAREQPARGNGGWKRGNGGYGGKDRAAAA